MVSGIRQIEAASATISWRIHRRVFVKGRSINFRRATVAHLTRSCGRFVPGLTADTSKDGAFSLACREEVTIDKRQVA
jgi:hypothetical protein